MEELRELAASACIEAIAAHKVVLPLKVELSEGELTYAVEELEQEDIPLRPREEREATVRAIARRLGMNEDELVRDTIFD